jgi:hypothetical protein
LDGEDHDFLLKLQGINADFSPSYASNAPHWLMEGGMTYFESESARPNDKWYNGGPFHRIAIIEGEKIEPRCEGAFTATWTVKSMGPDFD